MEEGWGAADADGPPTLTEVGRGVDEGMMSAPHAEAEVGRAVAMAAELEDLRLLAKQRAADLDAARQAAARVRREVAAAMEQVKREHESELAAAARVAAAEQQSQRDAHGTAQASLSAKLHAGCRDRRVQLRRAEQLLDGLHRRWRSDRR